MKYRIVENRLVSGRKTYSLEEKQFFFEFWRRKWFQRETKGGGIAYGNEHPRLQDVLDKLDSISDKVTEKKKVLAVMTIRGAK